MTKRLTAADLRGELQDLKMQYDGCEARIRRRAANLVKQFPDVQVGKYPVIDRYVPIYAKEYGNFSDRTISDALHVIETIEKHLESLHPHKQTAIDFSEICNCDGRDMPVYEEDGKRWCPQCGYQVI